MSNLVLSPFVAIAALASILSGAKADDCDATAAEIAANVIGISVGERISQAPGSDTIRLEIAAADDAKLICAAPNLDAPAQVEVTWHSAYPPPPFYDFVSAAGGVITTYSPIIIRRSVLNCQKQALSSGVEDQKAAAPGLVITCHVSTQKGGSTTVRIRPIHQRAEIPDDSTAPLSKNTKKSR